MGGTHKVYSGDRTIDGVVVQIDGSIFRASEPLRVGLRGG